MLISGFQKQSKLSRAGAQEATLPGSRLEVPCETPGANSFSPPASHHKSVGTRPYLQTGHISRVGLYS